MKKGLSWYINFSPKHHRKIYKSTYVPYDWVRAAVA